MARRNSCNCAGPGSRFVCFGVVFFMGVILLIVGASGLRSSAVDTAATPAPTPSPISSAPPTSAPSIGITPAPTTQGQRNLATWLASVAQYNSAEAYEIQATEATVSVNASATPHPTELISQRVEPAADGYLPDAPVTAYALRASEVAVAAIVTSTVAFHVQASINGTVNSTFDLPSVYHAVTLSTDVYCRCTSSSFCECLQSDLAATECVDYLADGRTYYTQRISGSTCSRGFRCGTCTRPTFFTDACFPITFLSAASGWGATTLRTCEYPFSGTYARPTYASATVPSSINVTLRSDNDPYVLLSYQTDGSLGFYDPRTPSPYTPPRSPYYRSSSVKMSKGTAQTFIAIGAIMVILSTAGCCALSYLMRVAATTMMTTTTTTIGVPGGAMPGYAVGGGPQTTTTTTTAVIAANNNNTYGRPPYGNPGYGYPPYNGGFLGTLFGMNHYNPNAGMWAGPPQYPMQPPYPGQQPSIQIVQVHPAPQQAQAPQPSMPMGYVPQQQPQQQPYGLTQAYSAHPQPAPPMTVYQPQPPPQQYQQHQVPPPQYGGPTAAYGPPSEAAASAYPVYGVPVAPPPMGYPGQQLPTTLSRGAYSEMSPPQKY